MPELHPRRQRQLETFVQKLGLPDGVPVKWSLLDLALTHSTVSSEANYEQLEFVGDAVARLAAAEFLWTTYPDSPVSEFAAIRSVLVSDRVLAEIARSYSLDRYLLIAPSAAGDTAGEESRLADALEAVLGVLYLSRGNLELVRPWLDDRFQSLAAKILADPARQNYKAALQEWTQARYKVLPDYRVREAKSTHGDAERFEAQVWLQDRYLGCGRGRSIKNAEQEAAKQAYRLLQNEEPSGGG